MRLRCCFELRLWQIQQMEHSINDAYFIEIIYGWCLQCSRLNTYLAEVATRKAKHLKNFKTIDSCFEKKTRFNGRCSLKVCEVMTNSLKQQSWASCKRILQKQLCQLSLLLHANCQKTCYPPFHLTVLEETIRYWPRTYANQTEPANRKDRYAHHTYVSKYSRSQYVMKICFWSKTRNSVKAAYALCADTRCLAAIRVEIQN